MARGRRAGRVTTIAMLFAMLFATMAAAPMAHADDATARQHFRRGVDLYDKKHYEAALESFRAAYAEKPAPGIKQNIALSLKGLGRSVEAATSFDEALDEGQATLRPDTRASIEAELVQLSKIVATVRIKTISASDKRPVDNVVVTVDGRALSPAELRRPIRLEPGIHVFAAHAEGLADPPEKKLSFLAGSPVDATFELGAPTGVLTVRASVAEAVVQVDGAEVGRGSWSGKLPAGTHRVTVLAPGHQTTQADVVVSAGAAVEYPITLVRSGGELPPVYEAPPLRKPVPETKKRYLAVMLAYEGQSFRLSTELGERAGGAKRPFSGASGGLRVGYRASRAFALEIYGDVGQLSESYAITPQAAESDTKVVHWQMTPVLRFSTIGHFRFTMATGIGVHGLSVTSDVRTGSFATAATRKHEGSGVAASWLVDLGMQFDVGSLFLEAVAFFDMHGVGTVRDNETNARLFLSSPGTRAGIRFGLGIPF